MNARKRALETCFDYTLKKAYAQIDDCSIGCIEAKSITRFLKQAGVKASKIRRCIDAIMRRVDTNGEGRLNFKMVESFLKSEPAPEAKQKKLKSVSSKTVVYSIRCLKAQPQKPQKQPAPKSQKATDSSASKTHVFAKSSSSVQMLPTVNEPAGPVKKKKSQKTKKTTDNNWDDFYRRNRGSPLR